MAEVYKTFHGMPFQEGLARWRPVQYELDDRARMMTIVARRKLREHRAEGHSFIETEKGRIDRWVILNDTRGLSAAMSMEYGRAPDDQGKGGMDGLYILHEATGAAKKLTMPRSRRRKRYAKSKRRKRR